LKSRSRPLQRDRKEGKQPSLYCRSSRIYIRRLY
jgi:hypothetical protein